METIKDEFTYFNEYNKTTEYQKFPAESYLKPNEENSLGLECSNLGKEVTTIQASPSKKEDKSKRKGLLDKIFNYLKNCATITAVATIAVVGATTITPNPSIELNHFLIDSTYIEYELSVEDLSAQNDYSIVISTTNQDDIEFSISENGIYKNKVEGLKPEWEYNFSFIRYDEYLGETILLKKTFQTKKQSTPPPPPIEEPSLPEYQIAVNDITIEGFNQVDIYFNSEKLDENCIVEFLIVYKDGSEQVVEIKENHITEGRVRVLVNGDAYISVTPIINIKDSEESIEFTKYEHFFTKTLDAKTIVNVTQNTITFHLKTLTNNATHAEIVDETTGKTVYNEELWDTYINYYYEVDTTNLSSYTLYLTNENGDRLSNGYSITFDNEYSTNAQYVFNYKNPNDVGITYNDDGTINIYIQTDFTSDNDNVFYIVTLDDLYFMSTEPIFSAIRIPDNTYSLTYDVCIEDDGIVYSIMKVTPSGAVNEYILSNYVYTTIENASATLEINRYNADTVDFSSIRIITSNNEEFILTESDWIYNEEYSTYYCTIEIPNVFEYVDIYASISPSKSTMEYVSEYQGSITTEFNERIYI